MHKSWTVSEIINQCVINPAVNPLLCLGRFSIDEGQTWTVHNFTSTSVFVDGLLSEPGDETLVMT